MRARSRVTLSVGVAAALLTGLVVPADAQTTATTTPPPASCTNAETAVVGEFLQPAWSDAGGWSDASRYGSITTGDVDGDGRTELLGRDGAVVEVYQWAIGATGQPDPEQWVPTAPGPQLADSAGWDQAQYYSTIQTADLSGDGAAEIVARDGTNLIAFTFSGTDLQTGTWAVLPKGPAWSDAAGWDAEAQYSTIHAGDVDGNGTDDVIGLAPGGTDVVVTSYDASSGSWVSLPTLATGFDFGASPSYYSTLQLADVTGDGADEVVGRTSAGIVAWTLAAGTWTELPGFPSGQEWSDANGWNQPEQYGTVRTADVDGDGAAEVLSLTDTSLETYGYDTTAGAWAPDVATLAAFPQATWDTPQYYETLQLVDVTGDGADDVVARGPGGLSSWTVNAGAWVTAGDTFATLSDSNGWNDPVRYPTVRAIPLVSGEPGALVARSATGMSTWQLTGTAPTAAWTVPSMAVPEWVSTQSDPNDPLQLAYTYINDQLGYGPVLDQLARTDILETLQAQLDDLKPVGLNITRDEWDEVYDAVTGWVDDAVLVNSYFFDDNQSLSSLNTDQLMLTSNILTTIEGEYFDISGGEEIVAVVSEILAGLVAGVGATLDPGVLVVVLSLASAALSSWEGFTNPQATITAKYDDLLDQIDTAFCSSVFFLNEAFDQITGDLGHLTAAGQLVRQGTWGWGDGTEYSEAVAAMDQAQQIWAFQQFGSVAWRAGHCEPNALGDFFCDFSSTDTNAYLPPLGEFTQGPVAWKVVGTFAGSVDCVKSTDSAIDYLRGTLGVQLTDIFDPLDPVTGQATANPVGDSGWGLKVDTCN
jgi:hypothetical protein